MLVEVEKVDEVATITLKWERSRVKLPRSFYEQPTLEVAQQLLGRYLVHISPQGRRVGRIVETEAYIGPEDLASHASRGLTRRTAVMFGPAGYAYVYLVYGMYCCLNVVTERESFPAAVLIRALEPIEGMAGRADGPGRLCRAMGVDLSLNGIDLTGDVLYLEDRGDRPAETRATTRVGVAYAGEYAHKPWRFYIPGSRWVSKVNI